VGRIDALDGLRGIAILLVLLVHATGVKGGLLGVDLFFVLSGYLITSVLLSESRRTGNVSLRRFFGRRAVRLMPALFLVVMISTAVALSRGAPVMRELGYAATSLTYTTNLVFIANHASVAPQFNHLWSLAVEEQFYLVWPLVLVVALRRRLRIAMVAAVVSVATVLSIVDVFFLAPRASVYTAPDTRANELLMGCLVALAASRGLHVRGWVALIGGVVAVWCFMEVTIWDDRAWPAFAAACALVVSWAASGESGVALRLLSLRPLVFLGVISYGLYLWHAVLLNTGFAPWFAIPVSLLIARESWRLLEQPLIRRYRSQAARRATPGLTSGQEFGELDAAPGRRQPAVMDLG
jgi:peptidoglycan/LPS O-acetylase OafA/YrhL